VTVLSQTRSKRDDGLRLGAGAYFATSDPATFDQLANSFDLIINTVSAPLDLNAYLRLPRSDGTLVSVGAGNIARLDTPADADHPPPKDPEEPDIRPDRTIHPAQMTARRVNALASWLAKTSRRRS
jgi:hypothetical protein